MNFQSGLILAIFLLFVLLLGIVEYFLLAALKPGYMRLGLPIYWRRLNRVSKKQFNELWPMLVAENGRNFWYPNLVFKRISPNELAFRHHFLSLDFGLANNKPFRGLIRYEPATQSIAFSGKLTFFEPFYLAGTLWIAWFFLQIFFPAMQDLDSTYSQGDYMLFFVQILILSRAFLAISHHKFSQHAEKFLSLPTEKNVYP